ncbi:SDR family NAD(P)-dependent oxidoreductase, partial [Rhodococcus erythropolis]|nr:SDR family NAD(P)-dependent oxidoreductase [Rhodococcus erythropolis]
IPLPTYPFQRTPHWLPKQEPLRTLRRQNSSADWFYAPSWQRTALPAGQSSVYDEHWLIFADNLGIGDAMSQRLRDGGATVTVVTTADEWSEPEPGQFTIHPTRSIDYERLSAALLARVPTRFVHCWSITAPGDDNEDSALRLGFESLIRLGQALSREVNAAPRDLWVFSNGLHNVNGTEQLSPLKAPLLGPCRVLPRELPGLRCRSIDLDFHTAPDAAQLGRLMKEVAARPETGVDTVAHRGIHRWSQHYLRRPLPEPEPQQSVVRTGGVYLITGGTGGLGLALADQLAASRARIVITARTPLPPEQEWDSWIANNHTGRTTDILRRLVRLRDRDTELLVVNADVSDQDAMAAAVRMAVLRWGAIDGVFHAAGVAGGGLIQLKDLRTAAEVMRPKVRGTMVLEAVLAEQDLDFVVLFSSNGANVGSAGQSDYCAANCFLDAFAQDRGRRNRVIAIDWGPWKDVGMTVTSPLPPSLERARRGDADLRGMSVREGLYALDTILSFATESQIIVSPVDPAELIAEAFTVHTDGPESPQTDLTGMSVVHHAVGDIERAICAVWQELLGVNHVGSQDSFFDLGGNSLIAIQLVHGINRRLGAELTIGDLYTGPTIAQLADRIGQPAVGPTDQSADDRKERLRKRREHQQRRREVRSK